MGPQEPNFASFMTPIRAKIRSKVSFLSILQIVSSGLI